MKLTKRTSRLLTAIFVVASLLGVFAIAHSAVQIFCWWQGAEEGHRHFIGIMNTGYGLLDEKESFQPFVVVESGENEPAILAVPISVMLYLEGEDFAAPNHWGFKAWKVQFYLRSALLVAVIVLLLCFAVNTLRGARSGHLFTQRNLLFLHLLSPLSFFYLLLNENIYLFMQLAISELYADRALIPLNGEVVINLETLLVPLLLVVVAQLYKVAIAINEEEVMTV